jgi:signal transduction histidine kinase
MTTEPGRGQGLRNMQERARLLSGQLSVAARPQPERGTIVRLILPIPIREKPALA